jgi:DNA polymerase III epsilon subunit-like protein
MNDEEVVVVDTETTGVSMQDQVVEIALVRVCNRKASDRYATLVQPGMPIPPSASQAHHIVDADVAHAPWLAEIAADIKAWIGDTSMLVAHNAGFLPFLNARTWLCTLRLAKHLYRESPSHRNQYLRYALNLAVDTEGGAAHRALGDALDTAALYRHLRDRARELFGDITLDMLADMAAKPVALKTINFGKAHFGKPVESVPLDYVRWALDTMSNLDADMRLALQKRVYVNHDG